jgi:hypothetical protein
MLRRRTCPGFDGRKHKVIKPDNEEHDEAIMEASADVADTPTLVSPESSAVKVSRSPSPSSQNSVEPKTQSSSIPFYRSVSSASTATLMSTRSSPFQGHEDSSEGQGKPGTSHLQIVAQISRDLNEICSDLSSKKGARRGVAGLDMCFGLDKSELHYSKIKCDLLTYDDEFDFEEEEEAKAVVVKAAASSAAKVDITPPSSNEAVIASITNACYEGRMSNAACSHHERQVSSNILRFLLTVHPQDPSLCSKLSTYLEQHPVLQHEFHLYSKALDGFDLKRDWVTFALNQARSVVSGVHTSKLLGKMSEDGLQAIQRCFTLWF